MSILDHPGVVSAAPSWRCPHCRTLQPEAALCRACTRAASTCSTCHLYRSAIVSDLGYCANDPTRTPLSGDESRSCWESMVVSSAPPGLFDEQSIAPPVVHDDAVSGSTAPTPMPPPLEAPGEAPSDVPGAAWRDADAPGRLMEAPHVAPGRQLMSELQRRSRRSRRD